MPDLNSWKSLLEENNVLRFFSEDELRRVGIDNLVLEGLKDDSFQAKSNGEVYLGALVLNYLARSGSWNGDQASNNFVLAVPFSECIDYSLTDVLKLKDDERHLVVEKEVNGENDLYIAIADLHFFTDKGERDNLTELATKYHQTRNPAIANEVMAKAGYIVMNIARKVKSNLPDDKVDEDDLFSEGMMALWGALKNYNPGKNVKFETYFSHRVVGSMKDALREVDTLNRYDRIKLNRMKEFRNEYFDEHRQEPGKEDYKAHWLKLELAKEQFDGFYCEVLVMGRIISLEHLADDKDSYSDFGGNDVIKDVRALEPIFELMSHELREVMEKDLQALPSKYRPAIEAYILNNMSMKEAAELIDVSESRFSQIYGNYVNSPHFFKRTKEYMGFKHEVTLRL